MSILGSLFGGLNDGRPGAFSQFDGSNPLERFLMQMTGSPGQAARPPSPDITMTELPDAVPAGMPAPQAAGPQPAQQGGMIGASAPKKRGGPNFFDFLVHGPDAGRIIRAQDAKADAMRDLQEALVAQPRAGGGGGQVPGVDGLSLNDPRLPGIAFMAKQAGVDLSDVIDVMKAQKPEYVNGLRVNSPNRAAPDFVPTLEKGQQPLFDESGRIVAVRNIDGSVQAAADMAGAVESAKARAQSPYQFQTFTGPDGRPITVTSETAAALGSKGGVIARGQSPAEASQAKIQGDAEAEAAVELPNNLATAASTLDVIRQLRDHPGRKFGTGGTGILPPLPGSPTKDFVTLLEQAKGKTFLEAFATLKGGGQITEREGQAAQSAIARLDRAQSEEGFLKALADLEAIVTSSMQRAQAKAGRSGGSASAAPRDPGQRQRGAVYETPRGPMQWTGTGWLPAN